MIESEELFLGQVFLDNTILDQCVVQPANFSDATTRRVFCAILKARETAKAADILTVNRADPDLDPAYVASLPDKVSSTANWEYYQKEIIRDFQLSRLALLGREITDMVGKKRDPGEIFEHVEKAIVETTVRSNGYRIKKLGERVLPYIEKLEARFQSKGGLQGISSGLDDLDDRTNGWREGMFYVIGARPSQGKSALALKMATSAALDEGIPTGFISLESSEDEIVERTFASKGHINASSLQRGKLRPADFQSILECGGRIKEAPLYVYDEPNLSLPDVRSIARRMVAVYGVKIIFLDYLQIVTHPNMRLAKEERIADVSITLKNLARELKIPVVALAQLRRDAQGRRPTLADFSDSSQIEKDADGAILIHHETRKDERTGEDVIDSRLLLEKCRDGATGDVPVVFQKEYVTFYPRVKEA